MKKLFRKILGLHEIDEAKASMYTSVTKATAAAGLLALAGAQNTEAADNLNQCLHARSQPLFVSRN